MSAEKERPTWSQVVASGALDEEYRLEAREAAVRRAAEHLCQWWEDDAPCRKCRETMRLALDASGVWDEIQRLRGVDEVAQSLSDQLDEATERIDELECDKATLFDRLDAADQLNRELVAQNERLRVDEVADAREEAAHAQRARDNWRAAADASYADNERIRAENERLHYEIMDYQVQGPYEKGFEHGSLVAVKYRDENERLRRALVECVGAFETLEVHGQMCHDARTAEFMARAALRHPRSETEGSPRADSTMQPKENAE